MEEHDRTVAWAAAAASGDSLAAAKLLAAYHPRLHARAQARLEANLQVKVSPEDLLQEVYLQVFQQLGSFEPRCPRSFLNWVYTILDHKVVDVRRAAHRQVRDVAREVAPPAGGSSDSYWQLLDQVYADSASPSRVLRREEAVTAVTLCLARLSPSQRQVIELRLLGGLPVREVARRLGRSEDAVVALTQRALKALRQAMDALGEFTRG